MADDTEQATSRTDIDASELGPNMWLIDEIYRRYRDDPASVGDDWKEFFEGFTPASEPPPAADGQRAAVRSDAGGVADDGTQEDTVAAPIGTAAAPSDSEVSPQEPRGKD